MTRRIRQSFVSHDSFLKKSFLLLLSFFPVVVVASRCKWQIAYHIFVYLSSHVWTPLCHEMNIKAAHLNVWLIGAPLTLNRKHLNRLVLSRCHDTLTFDKNGVQPRWASTSSPPPKELNRDKINSPSKKRKRKKWFQLNEISIEATRRVSHDWLIMSSWPYGGPRFLANYVICQRAAVTGSILAILSALLVPDIIGHPRRSCVWIALQLN